MTTILGINAYHGDSAACLVVDGKLVAAAEEERFRRTKHWAGFPSEAIRYCLAEAATTMASVDYVAINSNPKANLIRKIAYTLKTRPELSFVLDRIRNAKKRQSIEKELESVFHGQPFRGRVHHVEHHLAHLASAFHVSPYDNSCVVSVDGMGDFTSAAWGVGRGSDISIHGKVYFPHSLGIFYQALTQYLGFSHYGDEYKVMGLAPYGEPAFMDEMREIVHLQDDGSFYLDLKFFRHHRENFEYNWNDGAPSIGTLFSPAVETLLGPSRKEHESLNQRHSDIARSIQAMYEEAYFHLLNKLYEMYGSENLCLAGGCAMNSVANGKVLQNTPFKHVYIQSAAGDAGGAIGAAYVVHHQTSDAGRNFIMDHAYWGPAATQGEIHDLIQEHQTALDDEGCTTLEVNDENELCLQIAQAIADGKVVGWYQGRMEWGPRALGNRSILADPRRANMKDILNLKIKRRESFRPFAPSILREKVTDWFEQDADVPFMMKVFQVREEKRHIIPAVTHVDGSGRLQTVFRQTNARYYRLIESFDRLTGVPIILNTSFNENEPIVNSPAQAMQCFLRTKMDVLVLEDWLIARKV